MMEEVMKRLEATASENWNVGRETGEFLYKKVLEKKPKLVVEFGTSTGYSGIWLAKGVMENGFGKILTIESHGRRFEEAGKSFKEAGVEGVVTQIQGHAPECLKEFEEILKGGVDFVFLDLIKKDYKKCVEYILPYLSDRAWVITDNMISHKDALGEFYEYMEKTPRFEGGVIEDLGTGVGFYKLVNVISAL